MKHGAGPQLTEQLVAATQQHLAAEQARQLFREGDAGRPISRNLSLSSREQETFLCTEE